MDLIAKIEALFERRGHVLYHAAHGEPVTALAHALQCAQLAEWAHAEHSLVAAALLHDLGQLLDSAPGSPLREDDHELRALPLLRAGGFGPDVLEPIRLHVAARAYLLGKESHDNFLSHRHASQALQLSRWDELAHRPGMRTPPLGYYLALLEDVLNERHAGRRLSIA